MKLLTRLVVDLSPLRQSPAFRRLWIGGGLSSIGGQMTGYAVVLQVFRLTHSSLDVGLIGLLVAVPSIVIATAGGAFVDATDRRTVVLVGTSLQVGVSGALAFQAFAGLNQIWLLYCLVTVQSAIAAVNAPARSTFMPNLLPRDQLPAGAALQMFSMHGSLTIGPALAGLITTAAGLKACYLIDAISFGFALYGVGRLPRMRPQGEGSRPGLRAIGAGLRFIAHRREILGACVADMSATFFAMPFALFPAINAERFGGHPETLGLMTTAVAVGGILGSALSGPVGRVRRQGLGMLAGGVVWGVSLAGFGFAHIFWLAFLALMIAGAADVSSVVLRIALVQTVTPDEYLGRVSAVNYAVGAGVPQLGNFRAGLVADVSSPTISMVSGGIIAAAGAVLIGLLIPSLVRFRAAPAPAPSVKNLNGPRREAGTAAKAE